jgi:hypothetical protein
MIGDDLERDGHPRQTPKSGAKNLMSIHNAGEGSL